MLWNLSWLITVNWFRWALLTKFLPGGGLMHKPMCEKASHLQKNYPPEENIREITSILCFVPKTSTTLKILRQNYFLQ